MLSVKTIVTSLFSLGLVSGAFIGEASAAPSSAGAKHGEGKVERLCKRLECTDSQRAKIASISGKLAESSKADRQAIRDLKTKLADELAKDKPSQTTVSQIFADTDRRQDAIQQRTKTALLETHALLTSAQRVELAKVVERRGAKGIFGGKGKGKGKHKHGKHAKNGKHAKHTKNSKNGEHGEHGEHGKNGKHDEHAGKNGKKNGKNGKNGKNRADRRSNTKGAKAIQAVHRSATDQRG